MSFQSILPNAQKKLHIDMHDISKEAPLINLSPNTSTALKPNFFDQFHSYTTLERVRLSLTLQFFAPKPLVGLHMVALAKLNLLSHSRGINPILASLVYPFVLKLFSSLKLVRHTYIDTPCM